MKFNRAYRRHQHHRLLKMWRWRLSFWYYYEHEGWDWEKIEGYARFRVNVRTYCSCLGCGGNPRRSKWTPGSDRRTRQELLSELSFQEQVEEWYSPEG